MLLITGATGNLGASVVKQLLKQIKADQFIVTSSNEKGVKKLQDQGLQARLANFNDTASMVAAFQGVSKLLLISTMEMNRYEQQSKVIDAAKEAGVKHVLYTSLAIKDIQSSAIKDLMISHFQTEDHLINSGLTYTILRNTMYAEALTEIVGPGLAADRINLPGGDGKVPYVLRAEMGEATANLLLQENQDNLIYNITGTNAYSYADLAKELSSLTGKEITYTNIDENEYKENLKAIGFPDFPIFLHSGTVADIRNKQYEIVETTTEKLLGRPTADAQQFLKEVLLHN